jgi:hypothetical protein
MIQTGFESRVKVQQIIDSQLPSYVLDESPNAAKFLKQYYISQEYQGGPVDIAENLDQYLKLDNLLPEVITDSTTTTSITSVDADEIYVTSTKGFPEKYGLLKIDDEIITYTGIGTNVFTGCKLGRGFSGITNYHQQTNQEELIFSTSSASEHESGSTVQNISSLFLKEFYRKLKSTFAPELENVDFDENVNVGNFLKHIRNLYESKGTNESFRILFNVLYGVTPKIVNLEDFLIKSSSAEFLRREVVIAEVISGDPTKLVGQSIFKESDLNTNASVSEVESFTRNNKKYFRISLFVGYEEGSAIKGTFVITPNTKVLQDVGVGSSVISVDSTIGFKDSGKIISGINTDISYTSKSINQFFGCSGVSAQISATDGLRSDETYFGYEDGDTSKKVEVSLTGVLSDFTQISDNLNVSEGNEIFVSNLGEVIDNPTNKTYKEIFANSWIYNTSVSYDVDKFTSGGSKIVLKSEVDESSLKIGDKIELLGTSFESRVKEIETSSNIRNTIVLENAYTNFNNTLDYKVRRVLRTAGAESTAAPLEVDTITSDIQNLYNDRDEYYYVASNSLPSTDDGVTNIPTPKSYQINVNVKSSSVTIAENSAEKFSGKVGISSYSIIKFSDDLPFSNGEQVYYSPENSPIVGLETGVYFAEVISGSQLRLYSSRSFVSSQSNFKTFKVPTETGSHNFILNSQRESVIGPQKILRKFPSDINIDNSEKNETIPGPVGMLIDGVEIFNYKSRDKVYFGPLKSVSVVTEGEEYDVVNPPVVSVSAGGTVNALVQPVLSGKVTKIHVDTQEFDIDKIISIGVTGGNGSGLIVDPILTKRVREVFFNAKTTNNLGGINTVGETITFQTNHNFSDGEEIIYNSNGNLPIGINTSGELELPISTLSNNQRYFAKVLNNVSIQLYKKQSDYSSGINTVGFSTINTQGIHKFTTASFKNTISEIKVIDGGSYSNRKLIVNPSAVSVNFHTITFENHNFNHGDLVEYSFETSGITGLSASNRYFILKEDNNSFKLADAGIGATITSNFEKKKHVYFTSQGSGYQYFKYPDISAFLTYKPVGFGTTSQEGQTVSLTPEVRGGIIDSYLYESGTGYGSSIVNFESKPIISIKNGKEGRVRPIIINGIVDSIQMEYGGEEYNSVPDVIITDSSGMGSGAEARAIISNGKVTEIKVINSGIGYSSSSTSVLLKSAGIGAKFDSNVRNLTLNLQKKLGKEILVESPNKLQYAVCGYSTSYFEESGHSPIIGWAYDGNPIYGPYGHTDPNDNQSLISLLESGYSDANINNVVDRPSSSDFSPGIFVEDFKFNNSGDLDEYNGRFAKTPEFPNGVYAYHATIDSLIYEPVFPYFIGNIFKSKVLSENFSLNQSFDFINSTLIRNTFPYKLSDDNTSYDFVLGSDDVRDQRVIIESVSEGFVNDFEVVSSGDLYKVNDTLNFDSSETEGSKVTAKISHLEGKEIVDLRNTSTEEYENAVITRLSDSKVKVSVLPSHDLLGGDYVTLSGFSTISPLNGLFQIGITTYTSRLIDSSTVSSGIGSTEISVAFIPPSVSVGSSVKIKTDTLQVLNISRGSNLIRVLGSRVGYSTGDIIDYVPDSFTISANTQSFDSKLNDKSYFNPKESVGLGTTAGISTAVSVYYGGITEIRQIPTQSIFIEGHSFKNNQKLIFTVPSSGGAISISTNGGGAFDMPSTVYATNRGKNLIGIKTGITSAFSEVFFHTNGSDKDDYLFESDYDQVTGKVSKITSVVAVSTAHGLSNGDVVSLTVQPNLNVGIRTDRTQIYLERYQGKLRLNGFKVRPASFGAVPTTDSISGIVSVTDSTITAVSHKINSGDKLLYRTNSSGVLDPFVEDREYYAVKVDDDIFKLSETYNDSIKNSPVTIDFVSYSGGGASDYVRFELLNPQVKVVKGNNVRFTKIAGYDLKFYTDNEFKNEFVSTGSTTSFNVVSSTTNTTINYSENLPTKLYYNVEKSGFISTTDTDVKNYNEILYVDSVYQNQYNITGVGETTFTINLTEKPERSYYQKADCNILKYTTTSKTASGGISDIKILSGGSGYKKIPTVSSVTTTSGKNAYITPKSTTIGSIKETRIINENFEYPSDKTLRPKALISTLVEIKDANTVGVVSVTNGGINYTSAPSIILVDSISKNKINKGSFEAKLIGSSIDSIETIVEPKGLPDHEVEVYATNNTNGISIVKVDSDSSTTFTCHITTPSSGFTVFPFNVNDTVFIEGIEKVSSDGSGFNSEDYDFKFLKVSAIDKTAVPNNTITIDISGISTTNTGVAKTITDSLPIVTNSNVYPSFDLIKKVSAFIVDEKIISNNVERDLIVTESNSDSIKVRGRYKLNVDEILTGKESQSVATVNSIDTTLNDGEFEINYSLEKNDGWKNNIGKLDENDQVTPDNDYYQNLSYTVKSPITYQELITPVNSMLHTSGTKNFADLGITSVTTSVGIETSEMIVTQLYDIQDEQRVDNIRQFDYVRDYEIISDSSKFIEFKNRTLTDYVKINSDLVKTIDDISDEFSNLDSDPDEFLNILNVNDYDTYTNLLFRIESTDNSELQLTELTLLRSGSTNTLVQRGGIINDESDMSLDYGSFVLETDVAEESYLRFYPNDPYNIDYDIRLLGNKFTSDTVGVATTSVGFVNLINSTKLVSTNQTLDLVSVDVDDIKSLYANIQVINTSTNDMNFVELYLTHDDTNTFMAESFFDSEGGSITKQFIGSFDSNITSGICSITYSNDTSSNVRLRSKIIGIGTTSVGVGTYRFGAIGQPDDSVRSLIYQSDYSTGIGTTSVFELDKSSFNSVKSIIQVSCGSTKALHQVMTLHDGNYVYAQQSAFISVDSNLPNSDYEEYDNTSGIGTFGVGYSGDKFILEFNPDTEFVGAEIKVLSFNQCFYTDVDNNIPVGLQNGNSLDYIDTKYYDSHNGTRVNLTAFELTNNGTPIFAKSFNPNDSNILDTSTGKFTIQNHFFRNNEELIYTPGSSFVGVGSTPMEYTNATAGITSTLPSNVFAVVESSEVFQISTTRSGTPVTFAGVGTGNLHQFEMVKKIEKSVISIDNLIQYPLMFTPIKHSLDENIDNGNAGISTTRTVFSLSGISSIAANDILRIDDEYMKVINVGFGTTTVGPITGIGTTTLVEVSRGYVGSSSTSHSNVTGVATVYKGSYNIVGNKIFFTDPPRGKIGEEKDFSNLDFSTSDFNGRVYLRSDYSSNEIFDDVSHEFSGIGRTFTINVGGANTAGIGTTESQRSGLLLINGIFQSPTTLNNPDGNFNVITDNAGISSVVFTGIRSATDPSFIVESDYDVNLNEIPRGGIIISLGSTGGIGYAPLAGAAQTAIVGVGGSIIGVGTTGSFGSGYYGTNVSVAVTDLIYDHRFVRCVTDSITDDATNTHTATDASYDSYSGSLILTIPNHGLTDSNTVGIANNGIVFSCSKDHYATEHAYPRATSKTKQRRGQTGGDPISGIQTSITEYTINTITINVGSGGGIGTEASITATVGLGGTLSFNVGVGGTDYINPEIFVSEPSYENLNVRGISRLDGTTDTGIGLQMSVEVGGASTTVGIGSTYAKIRTFKITRPGYSFRKGDKFSLVGLVTDSRLSSPLEEFTLEVLDTYQDSFAFWRFGDLDYVDSIKEYQDGIRTRFPLTYRDGVTISFESDRTLDEEINFANLLLVFINGILQVPGDTYEFNGGTSFKFKTAPRPDDKVDIFFYKGTDGSDTQNVTNVKPILERGDELQIIGSSLNLESQKERLTFDISNSDRVETNLYKDQGLDDTNYRPVSIIKQKTDKVISGEKIYKTRDSLEAYIYPTARIIGNVSSSETNSIFVDNAKFFDTNVAAAGTFDALVVSGLTNPVTASATATINSDGNVTGFTLSGGSGYVSTPTVSISAPPEIAVGVGTTATATATLSNGSVNAISITNPGLGYTIAPRVLISAPNIILDNITDLKGDQTRGYSGLVTSITPITVGGDPAIQLSLLKTSSGTLNELQDDTPIYVFNTRIGSGVTAMDTVGVHTVGIGTTFADNVYHIVNVDTSTFSGQNLAIVKCKVQVNTGLTSIGDNNNPVGEFSWGELRNTGGFGRSSSISIGVTGLTIDAGLTTFPVIQRRGSIYGIRDTGALKKQL